VGARRAARARASRSGEQGAYTDKSNSFREGVTDAIRGKGKKGFTDLRDRKFPADERKRKDYFIEEAQRGRRGAWAWTKGRVVFMLTRGRELRREHFEGTGGGARALR